MNKYHGHSLALNDEEENDYKEIKKTTGFGVKKIFMLMIDVLKNDPNKPIIMKEED